MVGRERTQFENTVTPVQKLKFFIFVGKLEIFQEDFLVYKSFNIVFLQLRSDVLERWSWKSISV